MTSNATVATRTLPDHATCNAHKHYRLNCSQYEDLLARSGQCCEICGKSLADMTQSKLFIDHDISPWGVRGLLCSRCNTTLGMTRDYWPNGQEYLVNSWWRQQCAALSLPSERSPEPEIGAAIRNQWGTVFIHHGTWWETPYQNGHSWPPTSWDRLYASYGPHNLVPVDLVALMTSEECPRGLKWELGNSDYWAPVLAVIGVAGLEETA